LCGSGWQLGLPLLIVKYFEMYIFDTVVYFQLNELGRILINVCNVIPAGIVCFFPSYDYENTVYEHWKKNEIISKLELKKKVSFTLLTSVKYSIV